MKRKPASGSVPTDTDDYQVGYGKPPKNTQFKRGRSGNPHGRPKRNRNLRTIVREALNENVAINEGGRSRNVSRLDAVIRVALNNALKGDLRAIQNVIQLARAAGLMDEETEGLARDVMTVADQAIIASFLSRHASTNTEAGGDEDPLSTQETSDTNDNRTNKSPENFND